MQWKTVCFQCLQEVYNYQYSAKYILFKEDSVQSEASPTRFNVMGFFRKLCPLYWFFFCVFNLFHSLCVALSRYGKCTMLFVDIAKLVDIEYTLFFYQICLCIVPFLSCLYPRCRGHCNVGQDRVKIVSTLQLVYPVYIVDIVNIAIVIYIDFTSYLHCLYYILFKLTTSQCWSTSRRYRINVLSLLSSLHRRHCNVHYWWIEIVSSFCPFYLVYIVDIAMLTSMNWHHIYNFSLLSC